MAALIIGGLTVKPTTFTRLPDERGGGGFQRTVNGELRGRSDWTKRAWAGALLAEDDTELAAIQAQADPDVSETVSGDLIGSSVTCRVLLGDIETIRDRTSWYYSVAFTLREV
jgi:hypothetical protein